MNRFTRIVLAGVVLCLAACIPRFREPEVRLETVRVGGLGLLGGRLYVHLIVANPNSFRLESSAMRYAVEMGGPAGADSWLQLATGSIDSPMSVGARDSAVVEVPVDFTYGGLGSAIRTIIETGEFEYRLSGDLRVTAPVRRAVPFRHRGRVTLGADTGHQLGVGVPNGEH